MCVRYTQIYITVAYIGRLAWKKSRLCVSCTESTRREHTTNNNNNNNHNNSNNNYNSTHRPNWYIQQKKAAQHWHNKTTDQTKETNTLELRIIFWNRVFDEKCDRLTTICLVLYCMDYCLNALPWTLLLAPIRT